MLKIKLMKLESNQTYCRLPETTYLKKAIFLWELTGIFKRYFWYSMVILAQSSMYNWGFWHIFFRLLFSFLISLFFLLKLSICKFLTLFILHIHSVYNNKINFLNIPPKKVRSNPQLYILH